MLYSCWSNLHYKIRKFLFYLSVDVSKGLTISHMASHPSNARYPDATAITFDKSNFKVTVIYNDHSIYVWDVRDITKVG